MAGVSRQEVHQEIARRHLTAKGKRRMIDTDDDRASAYLLHPSGKRRSEQRKKKAAPAQNPKRPARKAKAKGNPLPQSPPATEGYVAAELRKKIADADKKELDVRRHRGELVPRADVESVFNKLIAVLTQQTLGIAQRCAPDLCAKLGIDDHSKIITAESYLDVEIRNGVEQQKLLMLDFIKECEEARTDEED